jgi:anti-anti-sigma factor
MKAQIQSVTQSQSIKQLCLSGILDSRCHLELQKQLNEWQVQANDRISLNLENVLQINSSGIGVLILLLKELKAKNISFKLCNPNPSVYLTLKMSGMFHYFKIDEPDPYLRTARVI